MLKIIGLPDKPASNRNNGSKFASSRIDNSKPAFRRNNGNGEVDGLDISRNGVEHAKKSEKTSKSRKLSKLGKSKSEKTFKSQNLAKSEKKLSKSGNSTNSIAMEDRPKFLISDARTAFNRLRLAFTKAPILWHFHSEYHI